MYQSERGKHPLKASNKITILVYHETRNDIVDNLTVNTKTFEQHMSFLKDKFEIVPLGEIVKDYYDKKELAGQIAITFDDGYRSNYLYATPILEKYGLPATFFIVPSYIDKSRRFMSWKQVKELSDKGYEIGSHTMTHRNLAELKPSVIKKEVVDSKMVLENKLRKEINLFAYPFGKTQHITSEIIEIVKEAGYKCCCSTTGYGRISKDSINLFDLRRTAINNMELDEFEKTLTAPNSLLFLRRFFLCSLSKLKDLAKQAEKTTRGVK